jgi:hypothetical protein
MSVPLPTELHGCPQGPLEASFWHDSIVKSTQCVLQLNPQLNPSDNNSRFSFCMQEYVSARVKIFAHVFSSFLCPNCPNDTVEAAYTRTLQVLGPPQIAKPNDGYIIRFKHKCR